MLGYSGKYIEPFALAVYRKSLGLHTEITQPSNREYQIGDAKIPLNSEGKFLFPYFAFPKEYFVPNPWRQNSQSTTNWKGSSSGMGILSLNKGYAKKLFENKIVLIGEDGSIFHDEMDSPYAGMKMPWVELHANMIDALLQKKFLRELDPNIFILLTIAIATLLVVLYYIFSKSISLVLMILSSLLFIYLARYIADIHRIVIPIAHLLIISILWYIITMIYRFFIVDRERRKLQKNFGHYVDPHVVQRIVDQWEKIKLWGESREVTILFSDIAGFTTISEKLTPEKLFTLMTDYLSRMTDILTDQGGTLDKYIGDAVMGFFGAPLDLPDHPLRACQTALLMREALPGFNEHLRSIGLEPIDFRVGMATGRVMVGNIGSEERFNYTVLGDTVNLASRLEGTGKEYDVHIIIPESTRERLGDRYIVRELDTIAVKGKTEWVRIYELIGTPDRVTNRYALEQYERALALYRAGKYKDAGILWEKQKDIDPPSHVMMDRCLSILKGETRVEGGIYHMTHK
jgi:adenylate cyclase